jgi:U4/U6 small nuclear ribonucleoprotein PRP4
MSYPPPPPLSSAKMPPQQQSRNTVEVMSLTAASQSQRQHQEALLMDLEVQKVAATVDVPTLPDQVRTTLRAQGQPVRLFGEHLADVRQRLRLFLARMQVLTPNDKSKETVKAETKEEEEEEVTKYTRALPEFIAARQQIATFSLERSRQRLDIERRLRQQAMQRKRRLTESTMDTTTTTATTIHTVDTTTPWELDRLDQQFVAMRKAWRTVALEGSQYGDSRSLSCIKCVSLSNLPLVITGGWTGSMHVWNGRSPALHSLGEKSMCHEDRIMGLDAMLLLNNSNSSSDTVLVATTSIDKTAKLWNVQSVNVVPNDMSDAVTTTTASTSTCSIVQQAHLQGHAARLCRVAFHPLQRHVATTSFDYTWRMWDIETAQELLLQDGHGQECYGIDFHPDGSLCATTDFASIVHVWDIRTGKSIHHCLGHAKRVLNAVFHINGYHLVTAGDDGTLKVWDLRRRQTLATIPAHSKSVTGLRMDATGEFCASSSLDGTVKLWSCRDWKTVHQLRGHEGPVSGVDYGSHRSLVTCGFDKTVKMWR